MLNTSLNALCKKLSLFLIYPSLRQWNISNLCFLNYRVPLLLSFSFSFSFFFFFFFFEREKMMGILLMIDWKKTITLALSIILASKYFCSPRPLNFCHLKMELVRLNLGHLEFSKPSRSLFVMLMELCTLKPRPLRAILLLTIWSSINLTCLWCLG